MAIMYIAIASALGFGITLLLMTAMLGSPLKWTILYASVNQVCLLMYAALIAATATHPSSLITFLVAGNAAAILLLFSWAIGRRRYNDWDLGTPRAGSFFAGSPAVVPVEVRSDS